MKKLILAVGCIAAITTFASCTAESSNDSNHKVNKTKYSKVGDTIGNGGKGTPH